MQAQALPCLEPVRQVSLRKDFSRYTHIGIQGVLDHPYQGFFSVILGPKKSATAGSHRESTPKESKFRGPEVPPPPASPQGWKESRGIKSWGLRENFELFYQIQKVRTILTQIDIKRKSDQNNQE